MSNQIKNVFEELRKIGENTKIIEGINEAIDKSQEKASPASTIFQSQSVLDFTTLIKLQASSKLALNNLKYSGIKNKIAKKLEKWENDSNFLLIRFALEGMLTISGKAFLGYEIIDNKLYPFVSEIQYVEINPVTKKIIKLDYVIGQITIDKKTQTLYGRYEKNENGYLHTRYVSNGLSVPEKYFIEETIEDIKGIFVENNDSASSDIASVIPLMKMRGFFIHQMFDKFEYLSPKIFNKDKISNVKDKDMKTKTFINVSTKAAQFGSPMTVFNPTLPNEIIMKTVDWLEDKIFLLSVASRPSDSGKAAQTNNLEQSLKNEQANNYVEYKKNLREIQFTKYLKKISKQINITLPEEFKVVIKLSKTQERLLNPEIDGNAAQGVKNVSNK